MFAGIRGDTNLVHFLGIAVLLLSTLLVRPPLGYGGRVSDEMVVGLDHHLFEESNHAGGYTDSWRSITATDRRRSIRLAKRPRNELEKFNPFVPHVEGAICVAIIHGSVDRVKQLITSGLDVNKRYRYGRTALMQKAVFCGSEIAAFLLDNGAKINATDDEGMNALMLAVPRCEPEMVEILIGKRADVNARAKDGSTALMWAVRFSPYPLVQPMPKDVLRPRRTHEWRPRIACILPITAKQSPGYEAHVLAHLQAERRWREQKLRRDGQRAEKVMKILINEGADVNAKNDSGGTALMQASYRERLLRLLLEKGAEVNSKDRHGQTALMRACWESCVESAKALIENGAEVNARDDCGKTTFMKTAESPFLPTYSSSLDNEKQQDRAQIAELLLEKGADINARSKDGETALKIAQKNGWHAMVKVLKAHGAKE